MKNITVLIAAMTLMLACKKSTLELVNPNQITSETYWKTEADVQSAFAATYGLLRDVNGGFWAVDVREYKDPNTSPLLRSRKHETRYPH